MIYVPNDNELIRRNYLKSTKKRCPTCNYTILRFRKTKGNYICVRCGTTFIDDEIIKKRRRLACHKCYTVNNVRYRVKTDDYYCDRCKVKIKKVENPSKSLYKRYLERKRKEWENSHN